MPTYDADLSVFEAAWNQAASLGQTPSGAYEEVPDGTYTCRIHTVGIKTSKAGNLMLTWQLKILGPTNTGRMIFRQNMLAADAQKLSFLRRDLSTCGVEPGKITDLRDRLPLLLDREIEAKVETKGAYKNVYINRLIRAPKGATSGASHELPAEGPVAELDETPTPF